MFAIEYAAGANYILHCGNGDTPTPHISVSSLYLGRGFDRGLFFSV
jgi:hypothetical protein